MKRLSHALDRALIGTACFGAAGLAIGTATAKPQSANAVDYAIDGKVYSLAASDPLATLAGTDLGNSEKCIFLLSVDASGNVTVTQGTIVAATADAEYPALPDGEAPIGALLVETNASNTFDPGTTDLNGTGVTTTYIDLSRVPFGTE